MLRGGRKRNGCRDILIQWNIAERRDNLSEDRRACKPALAPIVKLEYPPPIPYKPGSCDNSALPRGDCLSELYQTIGS